MSDPMFDLTSLAFLLNLLFVFAIGACVGSFLNVCAYRLPYERSFLWPSSRCGHCYQPIKWYHNIPLLSYWLLHGRCSTCSVRFSIRYFLVELSTALAFTGLFYLDIYRNVSGIQWLANERWAIEHNMIPAMPWQVFVVFFFHATLMSFLIVTSLCDLDHMEIPLNVTMAGTVVGLIGSMCFPWPFPNSEPIITRQLAQEMETKMGFLSHPNPPPTGLYPWPVWSPSPDWLPPGSWQLGLATGLAGAAAGTLVLRAVRFLFGLGRGMEGIGLGDADLMMMAGSFIGWQATVAAFAVGIFPALFFGMGQLLFRGRQMLPFGPSLAIGVMATILGWQMIGPHIWLPLSDPLTLGFFCTVCPALLLAISFLLRLMRGTGPGEPPMDKGDSL